MDCGGMADATDAERHSRSQSLVRDIFTGWYANGEREGK